ncbi:hypothetical protein A3A71_01965 [Candidatus Berkelbacteria bacterium RIFCSPLOWO2_01_FULL_50_28]|uniref:50S ribosomal protein L21 n=1 Tax=Candidatus Berkelbacteria bacterium RIFCSPLOWO2_01_FULL_50_28 TaxID=1797471 RepID=A0A1F5EBX0_9BACT|nr:MAG: hypothetical protein A3F39_00070 [Candidatus Berkelbacteria bacterium RIFCSPHIGHO2_12_FULL_50_11]OGD64790.1 MAG: hypothetical protein A3A71_01965 [Candidatus Berkelbacteria bacterium RIFCSPLOWO2_01_FULL_50_28]
MANKIDNWTIIELGGKQHLVRPGSRVSVNRLDRAEGDLFELPNMLDGSPVAVKVLSHEKGEKIRGLKFKNKVHYLRHYGHRQQLSIVEVLPTAPKSEKAATVAKATKPKVTPVKNITTKKVSVKKK